MIDPSLAVQKALRSRLATTPAVTTLVPAGNIWDRSTRPEKFPCAIVGDSHAVNESRTYPRRHFQIYSDIHLWTEESGLAEVKALAGAVYGALANVDLALDGCRCVDSNVASTKFLRDPLGKHGHAIVTFNALVELPL